jgi:hypothetical protein
MSTTTSIKRGMRVEWRSTGERRPFVFFRGTVLDVPTAGTWLGKALVDDDSGLNPRAVDVTRLIPSKAERRSVPLGGASAS